MTEPLFVYNPEVMERIKWILELMTMFDTPPEFVVEMFTISGSSARLEQIRSMILADRQRITSIPQSVQEAYYEEIDEVKFNLYIPPEVEHNE